MSTRARRTFFNSLLVGGSNLLNNLLMLILLLLLTRYLGTAEFGKYSYVLALGSIFVLLSILGTDAVIIRDLARRKEQAHSALPGVLLFRLALGVAVALLLGFSGHLVQSSGEYRRALWLYAAGIPLASLSSAFQAVLISQERFWAKGIVILASSVVQVLLAVFLVLRHSGWISFVLAVNLLGVGAGALLGGWLTYRATRPWQWRFPAGQVRYLLHAAVVYGYFAVVSNATSRADVVILQHLSGDVDTGLYSAAKRLFEVAVVFLSAFLTEALFPVISEFHHHQPHRLLKAYRQAMRVACILVTPLALLLIFYSTPVTELIYGARYACCSPALLLLAVCLLPAVWHTLQVRFLYSMQRERAVLVPCTFRLLFSLGAYWWCGQRWGYEGIAAVVVLGLTLELLWYVVLVTEQLGDWQPVELLARPLLANLVLAMLLFWAHDVDFLVALPIALLLYVGLLFTTHSISWQEIRALLAGKPEQSHAEAQRR